MEWLRHGIYGIALGLFLPIACRLFIVLQFYDQIIFFESLISSSSERQARVILGDSERQIAQKFEEAAKAYANNPTAFHLRAMNMLYEGLKSNATIVVVPSTAIESMNLGSMAGTGNIAVDSINDG